MDDNMIERVITHMSLSDWRELAPVLQSYDLEGIGEWFTEHVKNRVDSEARAVLLDLTRILCVWTSQWSGTGTSSDTVYNILRTKLMGDAQCVAL